MPFCMEKKMLKACRYCGKIHDSKYDSGKKPKPRKRGTQSDKFHSSFRWTETAKAIKNRDHYLCQACLYNLDGQGIRYTTDTLEVHHIISLLEDWDMRVDWDNLITLCRVHHEMAEAGKLDRQRLTKIVHHNGQHQPVSPRGYPEII